jgi:DNA-directed RNA polymerase specialized sigma24 family protein
MDTFKQFLESTADASGMLSEESVQALIARNTEDAFDELYAFAYRIAGLVSIYARKTAPDGLDDGDWQDAVQECMVAFPSILERYSATDAPFLKYVSRAFQNVIKDYLWSLAKGGTGTARSGAQTTESETNDDEQEEDIFGDDLESYSHVTRDPLDELLAEEAMHDAIVYASFHRKRKGRLPEGIPPSASTAVSMLAKKRKRLTVRRRIALKQVSGA